MNNVQWETIDWYNVGYQYILKSRYVDVLCILYIEVYMKIEAAEKLKKKRNLSSWASSLM